VKANLKAHYARRQQEVTVTAHAAVEKAQRDAAAQVAKAKREAAARETTIRQEATKSATAALAPRIAAAINIEKQRHTPKSCG
jgi:hypothetical protein